MQWRDKSLCQHFASFHLMFQFFSTINNGFTSQLLKVRELSVFIYHCVNNLSYRLVYMCLRRSAIWLKYLSRFGTKIYYNHFIENKIWETDLQTIIDNALDHMEFMRVQLILCSTKYDVKIMMHEQQATGTKLIKDFSKTERNYN